MPLTFMHDEITRLRPGAKTERGSSVPDWTAATSLIITGCSIQPAATSLDTEGRVLSIEDAATVYAPKGADVKAGDRIVANGLTYEIRGEPRTWGSASGRLNHIQLNLVRWRG